MSDSTEILKKMMDVCALRQTVLANNIANANTANYKRQDVDFKKTFAEAIKSGDSSKLSGLRAEVKIDKSSPVGDNGNSVSMQKELGRIADNNVLYALSARALTGKYERMKKVINDK